MRMIWVKWSEDKFPVTSFKAEQFVINETENANQAKLEENGVTSDQMKNNVSYSFFKDGVTGHGASSNKRGG